MTKKQCINEREDSLAVPMMVYGFWEGVMTEAYQLKPTDSTLQIFKDTLERSEGCSEMRKIGEAIDAAQKTIEPYHAALTSGMGVVQNFTEEHLKMGMYAPVCFAWIPNDIRPRTEELFQENKTAEDDALTMVRSLAATMVHTSHPLAMRDINTVMNCVIMRAYRAGLEPQNLSDILNESFQNEQRVILRGGITVTAEQQSILDYVSDALENMSEPERAEFVKAIQEAAEEHGTQQPSVVIREAYEKFADTHPQSDSNLGYDIAGSIYRAEQDEECIDL